MARHLLGGGSVLVLELKFKKKCPDPRNNKVDELIEVLST